MGDVEISKSEARRIAIRAQYLDRPRPTDLLGVVTRLTLLQIDPTAAIAPNADLIAWTRIGSTYDPAALVAGLEVDRSLFELNAMVRPMADLGLYLPGMALSPVRETSRQWLVANDSFRRDIIDRLTAEGPLVSRDIPDTCAVPWPSTGWTNNRNVTQMLEFLALRGEVATSARRGKQRVWDIPSRVYPADIPLISVEEATRLRDDRRLKSLGIVREAGAEMPYEPAKVGNAGVRATVPGVPGFWRVDPEAIDQPFEGRTALLSPFDRLIHERVRTQQLFDFEYALEMYKPAAARRWGYFALPILHRDALVGKLDAQVDRRKNQLLVKAIHEDVPFDADTMDAVRAEIADLALWQAAEVVYS